MNRKAMRDYTLLLADEFDVEESEGLFNAENLNVLINISKNKTTLDLAYGVPKKFRKIKLIDITANQRVYSIAADLLITDFLDFQDILQNVSGKRATPLIEIDADDEWRYEDLDELTYWGWEDKDSIFIGKTATSTVVSRLKSYYTAELPDLTKDSDEPAMPKVCHPLISIDVLKQFTLADEGSLNKVELYYQKELLNVINKLSTKSNFVYSGQKPSVKEVLASRDA